MGDHRLKVRIGDHEFEAEGSEESVERQFAIWKELIANPTVLSSPPPPAPPTPPAPSGNASSGGATPDAIEGVYRREGPVITLSVVPNGPNRDADAALLILLGHRVLLGEETITGTRLMQGLARSGVSVARADRVFGEYMDQYVIRSGVRKGVRYRLTTLGMQRATELAKELLARVQ